MTATQGLSREMFYASTTAGDANTPLGSRLCGQFKSLIWYVQLSGNHHLSSRRVSHTAIALTDRRSVRTLLPIHVSSPPFSTFVRSLPHVCISGDPDSVLRSHHTHRRHPFAFFRLKNMINMPRSPVAPCSRRGTRAGYQTSDKHATHASADTHRKSEPFPSPLCMQHATPALFVMRSGDFFPDPDL